MSEQVKFPKLFAIDVDKLETVQDDPYHHIWGKEKWPILDKEHGVTLKFLTIFPGFQSSKHAHGNKGEDDGKWEYFVILSGELTLDVWDQDLETYPGEPRTPMRTIEMPEGSRYYIPEMTYHRFKTGTKAFTLLCEVSGYENDKTHKLEKSRPVET